jgi:hypothetical protein
MRSGARRAQFQISGISVPTRRVNKKITPPMWLAAGLLKVQFGSSQDIKPKPMLRLNISSVVGPDAQKMHKRGMVFR